MNAAGFSQYDVVRVLRLPDVTQPSGEAFDLRSPQVGDVATIIEIYADPPGVELECCYANGITQWLAAFRFQDVLLELVK